MVSGARARRGRAGLAPLPKLQQEGAGGRMSGGTAPPGRGGQGVSLPRALCLSPAICPKMVAASSRTWRLPGPSGPAGCGAVGLLQAPSVPRAACSCGPRVSRLQSAGERPRFLCINPGHVCDTRGSSPAPALGGAAPAPGLSVPGLG